MTLEIPFEDFDRLKAKKTFTGVATPVSDIGMIFITNVDPVMNDENVRLAAILRDRQAGNHQAPAASGYGIALATLEAPEYDGVRSRPSRSRYDPKKAADLLKASGYSAREAGASFKIQTTRGFKPKDYEMIQAIVGMWRKVGIEADISRSTRSPSITSYASSAQACADGLLQLGQCHPRPDVLGRFRDVRPLAPLGLQVARARRQDRPALG